MSEKDKVVSTLQLYTVVIIVPKNRPSETNVSGEVMFSIII